MSFSPLAVYQQLGFKPLAISGTFVYNVKVNQGKEKSKLPGCVYFTCLFPMNYENQLLSVKQVCEITSISRSTVYRKVDAGTFPPPVHLGGNMVRWVLRDIQNWIQKLK